MPYQIFVMNRKSALDELGLKCSERLRTDLLAAERLALDEQRTLIGTKIAAAEGDGLITTPPMSRAEQTIWEAWLPTHYGKNSYGRTLAKYNRGCIPSPVFEMWANFKQSEAFKRYEIWESKDSPYVSLLVGVNGDALQPLAQWGEADATLLSYDDMKRELRRRWENNERVGDEKYPDLLERTGRAGNAFTIAIVSVIAVMFVSACITQKTHIPYLYLSALPVFGAVFMIDYRRQTKYLRERHPVMRAICGDNSQPRELLQPEN